MGERAAGAGRGGGVQEEGGCEGGWDGEGEGGEDEDCVAV